MTGRIFSYHIFWKEYRQMRSFWLSLLVVAVVLQLIFFAMTPENQHPQDPISAIAVCFAALYALGCGATMFAMEHDNGTYDFLRALPTNGLSTFLSKVTFTLISAPLLFAATFGCAAFLSSLRDLTMEAQWVIASIWCLGALTLFAWATLFSLLMRHVVPAALLGGFAGCVTIPLVMWAAWALRAPFNTRETGTDVAVILSLVIAAVAIANVWLGTRWFREAVTRSKADDMARRRDEFAKSYGAYELETVASKGTAFAHLLWLQWLQSRGMILVLTGLVIWFGLALVTLGVLVMVDSGHLRNFRVPVSMFVAFGVLAGAAVLPVAGASVFAGDQKQSQFRFLADHGLSPKTVWWSRHPVWIGAIVVWLAMLLIPAVLLFASWTRFQGPAPGLQNPTFMALWLAFPALLCVPLAYCFGQLCSMLFRSGILAITFSIIGSYMLAWWAFGMSILHVPLIWSVVPIPVILLVATRVRTRGWLTENNTFRSWLPVVLILVVPGAAILSGVCLYRVYSIPWVEPGFNVAAFTAPASPEAVETGNMYFRAHQLLASEETADEAMELIVQASRRPECNDVAMSFSEVTRFDAMQALGSPILDEGKRLQDQGDLDGAAEQYLTALQMARQLYQHTTQPMAIAGIEQDALSALVDWSVAPGQSEERIVSVIREVEELVGDFVPVENTIKANYVQALSAVEGDLDDMFRWQGNGRRELTAPLLIYRLPWEQARARRNLRQATWMEMNMCQRAKEDLRAGRQIALTAYNPAVDSMWLRMNPDVWLAPLSAGWSGEQLALIELERRSALIQMALAAWQIEHDSLPILEMLQGSYLRSVPLDPFSGEPFVYLSAGGAGDLQPIFWSTGPEVFVCKPDETHFTNRYCSRKLGAPSFDSAQQVLAAGRTFKIPRPR